MQLVIVESPAKAKTIGKYLGKDFKVVASYGHVRNLPSHTGSVEPENNFLLHYEISKSAAKHIKSICDLAKEADTILLATDPDREGEAISWHVVEILKQKKIINKNSKVKRIAFNEVTKKAIEAAIQNARDVDMDLVHAQQARQALDYLVGFEISPILWRKLPGSRSAGRVQSVALRLICDRENEIEHFKTQEYWTIDAEFNKLKQDNIIKAKLISVDKKKLEKFSITNKQQAESIVEQLIQKQYSISDIERKQQNRNPYAPFTTSSLQQEASHKLGMSARQTMQVAQKLYEGIDIGGDTVGLITYMRTDGVQISQDAMESTRQFIKGRYGEKYLSPSPRMYKTKAKNAQEAHEAIRPTHIDFTPEKLRQALSDEQYKLYDLIWRRLIASQMASMVLDITTLTIESDDKNAEFRATGTVTKFDGFQCIYKETVEDSNGDEFAYVLPEVNIGDKLDTKTIVPNQHFTEPPPRYSEASLVKKLEELGIGRPSTYATIISVLQEREYVRLDKRRFFPEQRGRILTIFLVNFFEQYFTYDFTAHMEEQLDDVSDGRKNWLDLLRTFWQPFHTKVEEIKTLPMTSVTDALNKDLAASLLGDEKEGHKPCPSCKDGQLSIRIGKYGAFMACSNYPDCDYKAKLAEHSDGSEEYPKILGDKVSLRKGPYGLYVQRDIEGEKTPKRSSIPKHIKPENITYEVAIQYLSLPRTIGIHPETSKNVQTSIGRFGPYLLHDGKYTSLSSQYDLLTITLEEALEVIANKKTSGKSRKSSAIKVIVYPETGKNIEILKGKYGPYIKYNNKNISLPKDFNYETATDEEIIEILTSKL